MLADDSSKETFSNEVISVDTAPVLNVESEVKEGIMNQEGFFLFSGFWRFVYFTQLHLFFLLQV